MIQENEDRLRRCSLALPPLQLALARNENEMTTTITAAALSRPHSYAALSAVGDLPPPHTPLSLLDTRHARDLSPRLRTPTARLAGGGGGGGGGGSGSGSGSGGVGGGGSHGSDDDQRRHRDGAVDSYTWLRRLSSTMTPSRESSRGSASRPGSSAVSHSTAFSTTASTTPMLPSPSGTPTLAPNKLVKRATSLRSSSRSSSLADADHSATRNSSPSSRLPLPILRRPATSHERSAALQESLLNGGGSYPRTRPPTKHHSLDEAQWQHFWTPRTTSAPDASERRHLTGIPNPIKRIYPHPTRRYTPVLVSAREPIRAARVELDDSFGPDFDNTIRAHATAGPSDGAATSTPQPAADHNLDHDPARKGSSSITDVLSRGPQQLLRRPSMGSRRHLSGNKLTRRRTASSPAPGTGHAASSKSGDELEPPFKRRGFTDPRLSANTPHSSTGSFERKRLLNVGLGLGFETHPDRANRWQEPLSDDRSIRGATMPSTINDQQQYASSASTTVPSRYLRLSNAPSDVPSTVDSDGERHSVGDVSTDCQSEAVWDSFPTRTTRSSLGRRGPPIDTIFDDSPPLYSSGKSTKLKDFLGDGSHEAAGRPLRGRQSTIEEEASVNSTPPRKSQEHRATSSPSVRRESPHVFASSPPASFAMPDLEDSDWDAPDDNANGTGGTAMAGPAASLSNPFKGNGTPGFSRLTPRPHTRSHVPSPTSSTPRRNGAGPLMEKANIFDWSESQPSPAHNINSSPPRPKTVHGKKEPDNRGSRSAGRRVPSGLHTRSHSVPVVPDVEGKRAGVAANKFGTWGVGSKGVSEDWNEDFDFEDEGDASYTGQALSGAILPNDKRIDSGHEMFVPRSIREQTETVRENMRVLRDWHSIIGELKALRVRASAMNMLEGPHADAWAEVDAMIELADHESDEQTLEPAPSPPSSPTFDFTAFDEPGQASSNGTKPRRSSGKLSNSANPSNAMHASNTPLSTRPRKDSQAVALSVIEALQSKRSPSESLVPEHSGKVPFDGATLRHIVPYVRDLKRKVKDALRDAEGLVSTPNRQFSMTLDTADRSGHDEGLRALFEGPNYEFGSPVAYHTRQRAETDHNEPDVFSLAQQDDLTARIGNMGFGRNVRDRQN